jgi:hypothetical protein
MATACLGHQEFLDALLARLLVLLRKDPHKVTPAVIGRMIDALGRLTADCGVSASDSAARDPRSGASKACQEANRYCLEQLHIWLVRTLPNFLEEDLGLFHDRYVSTFLKEDEIHRVIIRAAQLQLGFGSSTQYFASWRKIVLAVQLVFPSLISSLPMFAASYCDRLGS